MLRLALRFRTLPTDLVFIVRRPFTNMSGAVIVRRVDGEESMALSLSYSSPLVAERQFNFRRRQDEQLKSVLSRIALNVGTIAERKLKKLNKKGKDESTLGDATLHANPSVTLTLDGTPIDETTAAAKAFAPGAVLTIGETPFRVEVNPPLVASLTLPKHIMSGFDVYPNWDVEFTEKGFCNLTWMRSTTRFHEPESSVGTSKKDVKIDVNRLTWEEVGRGFVYEAKQDDVGRYLKVACAPKSFDGREGPLSETVSPAEVTAGPGPCPFEKRHVFTNSETSFASFRVITYNILANLYADSEFSRSTLFPTCPDYALSMDYRKQLLLKEIRGYNGDVICLQEVDIKLFNNDLVPALGLVGMEGHLACKGGQVAEGLACFYNKKKFKLINHRHILLSEATSNESFFNDFMTAINANEQLKTRFLDRTTVLQIVVLESLEVPNKRLCVANTHLYFHPNADHIRLLQAGVCLRYVEQVVAQETAAGSHEIAVIFCGDFNSTPESGVYQLMTTQYIPEDHERWNSTPEECVRGLSLSHPFSLISASGTPDYTNFTVGFYGCLDYIYADSQRLAVHEVVPLPSHEEVTQYEALPSLTMPSDHIALVCTLEWQNKK